MEQVSVVERDAEITHHELELERAAVATQHQYRLLERLIAEGSDALAFHVCRRLQADRVRVIGGTSADTLGWAEIAEWAKCEGLVNEDDAFVLQRPAGFKLRRAMVGAA